MFTLAVSNDSQIDKLFTDTPWADGWFRQLQRIEGAKIATTRFTNARNGTRRCIFIPLKEAMGLAEGDSEPNVMPDDIF